MLIVVRASLAALETNIQNKNQNALTRRWVGTHENKKSPIWAFFGADERT